MCRVEKRGIPATVIVTDVFETRAHQLLTSLGYPHIPVLVTANPVIYLDDPGIHERINTLPSRRSRRRNDPDGRRTGKLS